MKKSVKNTAKKTLSLLTAVIMLFVVTAVSGTVVSASPSVNAEEISLFY